MTNSLQRLQELGQSVWFDNIRRGFIKSGELRRLIDLGVSGLTSNPSIFEKATAGSNDYDDDLEVVLADLDSKEVPRRIWERDHTVWKPDPNEIGDRLGWLTVAEVMLRHIDDLASFGQKVKSERYEHVVLLGMGGSSLSALALHKLFGSSEGYPDLIVADTILPASVRSVSAAIDVRKTLFIVASKSGSTIEPNVLYKHFRKMVENSVGTHNAGSHFVAICDAGTALERLARQDGFRRVFTNVSDIGGRYSVQSLFGLVPATLIGVDIAKLLDRVRAMSSFCGPAHAAKNNPGAWLGAAVGRLVSAGRDKLTIVTTKSLEGFGLWIEQLLAESTGKEGKGIIPVTGEPLCKPVDFGDDRLFVYIRLSDDDTEHTDAYIESVEKAGIPTIRFHLADRYDIGEEFFRWEFATAVAGSLMGINPFDQPDVQQAKDSASRLVEEYGKTGDLPTLEAQSSFGELMAKAKQGKYVAIIAYAEPTSELEEAVARLRRAVSERYGIATTFGYGPRYLHSTGQLHKGGPNSGLFLQLTQIGNADVMIPGERFTFGILAASQAKSDLETLARLGRPVARIHLDPGDYAAIDAAAGSLS